MSQKKCHITANFNNTFSAEESQNRLFFQRPNRLFVRFYSILWNDINHLLEPFSIVRDKDKRHCAANPLISIANYKHRLADDTTIDVLSVNTMKNDTKKIILTSKLN